MANLYELTYIGMDGSEQTETYASLEAARRAQAFVEGRGAQCVEIYDPEGNPL